MNDWPEAREKYDIEAAAAWILGHARRTGIPVLPDDLLCKDGGECTEEEAAFLIGEAEKAELHLYPFKRTTRVLPRIQKTMGFLHSVPFETLLDVGSGRGAFLIPFVRSFPWVNVTSVDLLEKRVDFMSELADGGFHRLRASQADICLHPFAENSFDVVTMLEVLEHIPNVEQAILSAVRMAKHFVIVTVPSKLDNNPEHIHLLTKEKLTHLFHRAGCSRLHFDGVEGHLFLVAVTESAETEER